MTVCLLPAAVASVYCQAMCHGTAPPAHIAHPFLCCYARRVDPALPKTQALCICPTRELVVQVRARGCRRAPHQRGWYLCRAAMYLRSKHGSAFNRAGRTACLSSALHARDRRRTSTCFERWPSEASGSRLCSAAPRLRLVPLPALQRRKLPSAAAQHSSMGGPLPRGCQCPPARAACVSHTRVAAGSPCRHTNITATSTACEVAPGDDKRRDPVTEQVWTWLVGGHAMSCHVMSCHVTEQVWTWLAGGHELSNVAQEWGPWALRQAEGRWLMLGRCRA
jgi:hypothetical protein